MKKNLSVLMITAGIILCISGCGSSGGSYSPQKSAQYDGNGSYDSQDYAAEGDSAVEEAGTSGTTGAALNGAPADSVGTEGSTASTSAALDSEKIVYTGNVTMSSKNYDNALKQIKAASEKYGAIIQSENYLEGNTDWYYSGQAREKGSRSYYVSLRVPSKNYTSMLDSTGSMDAVVDSRTSNAENISQQYSDTQAEIESLQAELKQLNGIMEQATKVQDIMDIQTKITEVQTQLNQDESNLKRMDTDVAYSYIDITLNEVNVYEEKPAKEQSFGERVAQNFENSLAEFVEGVKDLLIFIVRYWIRLLIFVIIIFLIIFFIKRNNKKNAERRKSMPNPAPNYYSGYQQTNMQSNGQGSFNVQNQANTASGVACDPVLAKHTADAGNINAGNDDSDKNKRAAEDTPDGKGLPEEKK